MALNKPTHIEVEYGTPTVTLQALRDYLGIFYVDSDEDAGYTRTIEAATQKVSHIVRSIIGGGYIDYQYSYWQEGQWQSFLFNRWRGFPKVDSSWLGVTVSVRGENGAEHSAIVDQVDAADLIDHGYGTEFTAQFLGSFTNIPPESNGINCRVQCDAANLSIGKSVLDTAVLMECKYLIDQQNGVPNSENLPRADHFLSTYIYTA